MTAAKKGFWGKVTTRLEPPPEGSLRRRAFHQIAKLNVVAYRVTGGRVGGSFDRAPVCILHHRGAKSGEPRETPLVFGTDGETVVLIASMGGQPKNPAWYHNLVAHPEVEVERKGERKPMRARQVEGTERERMWELMTGVYPGFDDYQARTRRQIPVMVCEPR